MKLTAAIKMLPTKQQAKILEVTLARCNQACTWIAARGFEANIFRQFDLHRLVYSDIRQQFGLTAQAAVRCIAKVADAFKVNRGISPIFRRDAAQAYDDRIIRFINSGNAVSIWTVEGRITVPIIMGDHQRKLVSYRKGEVELCIIRGNWILAAACEIPETDEFIVSDWLGVDFGLISLATDSDGIVHSGSDIERIRDRLSRRKRGLQRRGTKAAKRRLRKLSGKEARFRKYTNHCISKTIVRTAERTERGIALEDLKGIRDRVTAKRNRRARLKSWAYCQLRYFISYKAKRCGVPVVAVSPRNTSLTCSCCGVISRRSRPVHAAFSCISCGHTEAADLNAARNIRAKAAITPPLVLVA